MKVKVDHDFCTGCGICESDCPAVFVIEEGLAFVTCDAVPADQEENCRTAHENCPVEAIELDD